MEKSQSSSPDRSDGLNEKGVISHHEQDSVQREAIAHQTGGIVPPPDLEFTHAEEDKVHRKLDYHLLPFVFVLYSLAVLDRSNLGNAKLAGLEDAIDLSGWRYNWLGTIFYIACTFIIVAPSIRRPLTSIRYLLSMDIDGMEAIPSACLLYDRRLFLGLCRYYPGSHHELGWTDDMSFLLGYCRSHVWTRRSTLSVLFLSSKQNWLQAGSVCVLAF